MDGLSNLLNEAADAVAGLACVKTLPSEASVKMGELLNCFRTSQGIDNQREPYPLQFLEEWALAEEKFLLSAYPVTDAVATRQAKEMGDCIRNFRDTLLSVITKFHVEDSCTPNSYPLDLGRELNNLKPFIASAEKKAAEKK